MFSTAFFSIKDQSTYHLTQINIISETFVSALCTELQCKIFYLIVGHSQKKFWKPLLEKLHIGSKTLRIITATFYVIAKNQGTYLMSTLERMIN